LADPILLKRFGVSEPRPGPLGRAARWLGKQVTNVGSMLAGSPTVADLPSSLTRTLTMEPGPLARDEPISLDDLYDMAKRSSAVSTCIQHLREEIFRKGIEIEPEFVSRCPNCGDLEIDEDVCPNCGEALEKPDGSQKDRLEEFIGEVNEDGESLLDLLLQIENDLDVVDDAYVVFRKEYVLDDDGRIVSWSLKSLERGDPRLMRIVVGKKGMLGGKWWVCLKHRDRPQEHAGECDVCGGVVYPVHYVSYDARSHEPSVFYIEGEVVHLSKYHPSKHYGRSPLIPVWYYALTLRHMERYISKYYEKMRPPKMAVLFPTRNKESVQKIATEMEYQQREDPYNVPFITYDPSKNNVKAEILRFDMPLSEMQLTEMRNEYFRRIGAVYGVMPLFQGDISMSGGLNNEGLQITVTNRAVDRGQSLFHRKLFPKICLALEVYDWKLVLPPTEERDEAHELQLEQMKVQIATAMKNLGFKVTRDVNGEFQYSQEPVEEAGEVEEPAQPEAPGEGERAQTEEEVFAAELDRDLEEYEVWPFLTKDEVEKQGQGLGKPEPKPGNDEGPGGYCVCPSCGTKVEKKPGVPCTDMRCPVCEDKMVREGVAR